MELIREYFSSDSIEKQISLLTTDEKALLENNRILIERMMKYNYFKNFGMDMQYLIYFCKNKNACDAFLKNHPDINIQKLTEEKKEEIELAKELVSIITSRRLSVCQALSSIHESLFDTLKEYAKKHGQEDEEIKKEWENKNNKLYFSLDSLKAWAGFDDTKKYKEIMKSYENTSSNIKVLKEVKLLTKQQTEYINNIMTDHEFDKKLNYCQLVFKKDLEYFWPEFIIKKIFKSLENFKSNKNDHHIKWEVNHSIDIGLAKILFKYKQVDTSEFYPEILKDADDFSVTEAIMERFQSLVASQYLQHVVDKFYDTHKNHMINRKKMLLKKEISELTEQLKIKKEEYEKFNKTL